MEHVRTPAGHKTPTQAVGFDASDASGGSPKQPSTPIRAGKKRARATSPTPSHRGRCDSGPTEGVPQWITGSAPFRTSGATKPAGSQLGMNIRTAYEAKAKRLSEAGQALAEMGDYISHKIDEWKKAGLSEALGLATEINNVVQNYCANLGKGSDSGNSSYGPNNGKSNPKSWASVAATPSPRKAQVTQEARPKKHTPAPAARVFIRLPQEHKARTASPYATLQKLRAELPAEVSAGIKGIQAVPSGLAITLKDDGDSFAYPTVKDRVSKILDGAKVEKEEKWAVYVIPDAPRSYKDYTGDTQQISEQQISTEFKLQTSIQPMKLHWANTQEKVDTGTLIIAVTHDIADKVPNWISLFGARWPIIRKNTRPRIQQCKRCWDYHNERTCTRKLRCRLCSSKEHTETGHTHCK